MDEVALNALADGTKDLAVIMALAFGLTEVAKRFLPWSQIPAENPWFDQDKAKLALGIGGFVAAVFAAPSWFGIDEIKHVGPLLLAWAAEAGIYGTVRAHIVKPITAATGISIPDPLNR